MSEINCILLSKNNQWSKKLFNLVSAIPNTNWKFLHEDYNLNIDNLIKLKKPDYIFVFHWSKIINQDIYNNFKCISFHTSNLPDGKGGSPIQNQIISGILKSRVNAIKTCEEIDGGDIYCHSELTLQGSLSDIWDAIVDVTYPMIYDIIQNNVVAKKQTFKQSEIVYKRNKNNEIPLNDDLTIEKVYDYIRMLDADGYNKAYISVGNFKIEFSRSKIENDIVLTDAKISVKEKV